MMAWGGDEERRFSGSDEDEEELDETDFKTQKDAVLFAIDVSSSMLEPPPHGNDKKADKDSAVEAALKCVYQIMQQRIIAQPKDMMGILLFGTEKSKFRDESGTRSSYPHCYLLSDLDVPAAEDVNMLKSMVEEQEDPDEVLVPATGETAMMANVLFCANQVFTTNAANFGSRRLFIITDNDNPHDGDKTAQSSAAVRAKDLYDLGVVIELFPISRQGKQFDISKFYDDIIYRDPAAEAGSSEEVKTARSGDGLTLLGSLISNINSKQTAKRSYFSNVAFELAPGLTISVNGYIPLHRQQPARTCYVWQGGEQAQLAQSETTKVDSEARTVEKSEVKKAYKFGGEYIYFNPDEAKKLKESLGEPDGKPIIRVIGFKPRAMLPIWASVKKSVFIFPSEAGFVGSTRVFSALWQKLLKSEKMGLAWFISRSNANPIMVAILPSKNPEEDGSGSQALPAGLWLYPLPFIDDVRNVDLAIKPKNADDLTDKMRDIVQNLQLPKAVYNPAKYPNPSLQWHYKILQAMALDEEVPETLDDATIPKYRQMDKRVGAYMAEWKEEVASKAKELMKSRAVKREVDDDDGARPAKRAKATAKKPSGLSNNAQLKLAVEEDTLKKMTVADLKDVLASKGLSTAGKKAELLERVEQWVEDNV
ncbi:SPOC like C-terminal domain-containing protein [Cercophora scortea]|uniref:ATP-dependent DNA helicase II subunit 1 n=1 Tax=Cercophora scortea TaxID=314031 RepID=A0AAE0IE51_9PEZI|nr:SPOC like C-terminal domain-containing protein [Cercophora scortea]